ncbi:cation:proton antiporter [Caulobacter sp. 17J65-9]|uniref:cation:proton antiporter domain-containing protein n=1 Tax=Caulobacter sp. 17J65-9 TaxID=2709382 RepID=UPI0013CAEF5B|nr:cation:proton antiporter [Caulobacter sp. 17J65-9]NEX94516.1 potassium transporter TrkA [Caulobacter sp. 17J65-9]
MPTEVAPQEYKDVLVFLAAASIVVPLFHRFKLSPVLGFLLAGVLLGPDGLGRLAGDNPWISAITISDADEIRVFAEFGVVFLLFMIGLELSWERLRAMRRLVFGFGMAQVVVCGGLLGLCAWALGQPPAGAVALGLALALSSTALVMPVLAERKRLHTGVGRAAFSVLLAQDLAVAPILVTLTVLGGMEAGNGASWLTGLLTLAPAALALAVIVAVGRLVLRPLFQLVAGSKSQELFVAACLLVVIGAGVAASVSGLSMAIGAFIAGLLLAETEFRREVEVNIEPFKGLLLGMFFVSVGIRLDLDVVLAEPIVILSIAVGLTALKIVSIFGVARAFRLPPRIALETAMVLGPAGEFAFVILNSALEHRLVDPGFERAVLIGATVSFFAVPALAWAAERLAVRAPAALEPVPEAAEDPEDVSGQVLIVGYGRVGRLVGEMLHRHDVEFSAVDLNAKLVDEARKAGERVYFGDAGRAEFLGRCGIDKVAAVVVTMDAPGKVDEVVQTVRAAREDVTLIARARDARHAARLYQLGATDAVPETVESSLQLAENTLVDLGKPMGLVIASIHEKRDEFRKLFQESAPDKRETRAVRAREPRRSTG